MPNSAYAITETVFFEDFDDPLSGWSQSVCIRNDPPRQTCNIGQHTALENGEPPNSLPNWGFVTILDVGVVTAGGAEVRFQKSFNVIEEDDYDVSSWLGTMSCSGCNKRTQLYIDGNLIFERVGVDRSKVSVGNQKFFDFSSVHLTAGMHDVEMAMRTNVAHNGNFRVSFDDITISREVTELPPEPVRCGPKTVLDSDNQCIPDLSQVCGQGTIPDFDLLMCFGIALGAVGGELLDINTASLLIGAIGTNPVITGLVGITLAGIVGQAVWFIHKKRKK